MQRSVLDINTIQQNEPHTDNDNEHRALVHYSQTNDSRSTTSTAKFTSSKQTDTRLRW